MKTWAEVEQYINQYALPFRVDASWRRTLVDTRTGSTVAFMISGAEYIIDKYERLQQQGTN